MLPKNFTLFFRVLKERHFVLQKRNAATGSEFDFVVVGAGIVGSWTAKELRKHGKVLLLEQFREPHTRGSSHGQSRIIRSAYSEPFFADLMPTAYRMWREAETETKEKLIETTGALYVMDSTDNESYRKCVSNMKRLCPENLVELTLADIKSKYPDALDYDKDYGFIWDKSGGIVYAHKAVRTIQQWFQSTGGLFWDNCKTTEIVPLDNKILVKTSKMDVYAKSLIVTAGPWTKQLLHNLAPSLPLQPKAIKVYYWKEKKDGVYSASSGFPVIIDKAYQNIYSIPALEYPGLMKVCFHGGVPCDPDERDKVAADEKQLNSIRKCIQERFPLLETEPSVVETCMYTCTPDEIFLIDTLPGNKNIVIGAGFSGSGFKTAPSVGRLLSELARGVDTFLDITPFSLSRFSDVK